MATTNLTTSGGLSAKMAVYYDRRMLDRLRENLVFHNLGTAKQLPANSGKIVQWFRRTDMAANTTPLSEGVVPTAIGLSATSISAQLAQYGDFTQTSDLIQLTSIDNEIEAQIDVLGFRAARSVDALDKTILDAGTNVKYANSRTFLSGLQATDVLTGAEVRKGVLNLKRSNVDPVDGNYYAWVVHPQNSYDLMSDTASGGWVNANTYVDTSGIMNGEIGRLFGARFIETTNVTTSTGGSGSANVYSTHLLGKGAFGTVEFDGGIHTYVKKSGEQDTSNPLNQYATVGYKLTYVAKMLDENRQVTYNVGSGA